MSLTAKEQYELGTSYLRSYEQHKDFAARTGNEDADIDEYHAKAVKWISLAADQGLSDAQCTLGIMYCNGEGVERDYDLAVKWFRKAARKGQDDPTAQYNLGVMYSNGWGVPSNNSQALKWWEKAAENGDVNAQRQTAEMYRDGIGVGRNTREAIKWFRVLAESGNADAQFNLGELHGKSSEIGEIDLSESMKWYRLAAEQGLLEAQLTLGKLFSPSLTGNLSDCLEAIKWYQMALDQGHKKAQGELARCKSRLKGLEEESNRMEKHREAAKAGDLNAQFELGFCYRVGKGGRKSTSKAKHWLSIAAERGHAGAQYWLGKCVEDEWDFFEETTEFFDLYLKAAQLGHSEAQRELARLYLRGEVVPMNTHEGFVWRYIHSLNDEFLSPDEVVAEFLEYDRLSTEDIEAETKRAISLHGQLPKYVESEEL